MSANQVKKSNRLAGGITLGVTLALLLADVIFFTSTALKSFFLALPVLLCGLILLLLRIKSYGYLIGFSVGVSMFINEYFQNTLDTQKLIIYSIAAVALLAMVIFKNVKK